MATGCYIRAHMCVALAWGGAFVGMDQKINPNCGPESKNQNQNQILFNFPKVPEESPSGSIISDSSSGESSIPVSPLNKKNLEKSDDNKGQNSQFLDCFGTQQDSFTLLPKKKSPGPKRRSSAMIPSFHALLQEPELSPKKASWDSENNGGIKRTHSPGLHRQSVSFPSENPCLRFVGENKNCSLSGSLKMFVSQVITENKPDPQICWSTLHKLLDWASLPDDSHSTQIEMAIANLKKFDHYIKNTQRKGLSTIKNEHKVHKMTDFYNDFENNDPNNIDSILKYLVEAFATMMKAIWQIKVKVNPYCSLGGYQECIDRHPCPPQKGPNVVPFCFFGAGVPAEAPDPIFQQALACVVKRKILTIKQNLKPGFSKLNVVGQAKNDPSYEAENTLTDSKILKSIFTGSKPFSQPPYPEIYDIYDFLAKECMDLCEALSLEGDLLEGDFRKFLGQAIKEDIKFFCNGAFIINNWPYDYFKDAQGVQNKKKSSRFLKSYIHTRCEEIIRDALKNPCGFLDLILQWGYRSALEAEAKRAEKGGGFSDALGFNNETEYSEEKKNE